MRSIYKGTYLAVIALALAATLSACGDDDGGGPGPNPDPDPGIEVVEDAASGGGDETDTGGGPADEGGGPDPAEPADPAPTAEARGILTMRGGTHELRLDPDWSMAVPATCEIDHENEEVIVAGMVSDSGYEIQMTNFMGWVAVVIDPEGAEWQAGANDPNPDADYTMSIAPGRMVVEGRWANTGGDTDTIRMELICP